MANSSHFDSGSLPSWLAAITAAGGTVTQDNANSELVLEVAALGDAAAVYVVDPIATNENRLIRFAMRSSTGTPNMSVYLVPSASVPSPTTSAAWASAALARISVGSISSNRALLVDYWDTGGTRRQWNLSTNAWATPTVGLSTVTAEDYTEYVIEVDGAGEKFRILYGGHHNSGSSSYTENQGFKYRCITDWVTFAGARSTGGDPLYVVIGYPFTDAATSGGNEMGIEWLSDEDGVKEYFSFNKRDGAGAGYTIGLGHRLGNARRGVPTIRGDFIGVSGSTTENTAVQMRTHLQLSDGTYVVYYTGVGSTGQGIHAATYNTWEGTVTKQGMMVPSTGSGDFVTIVSPFAVEDLTDPDPARRFKIFCSCINTSGANPLFNIYIAYASTHLGPFTLEGTPFLTPGTSGTFDDAGGSNPVVWWQDDHWEVWYAANQGGVSTGWTVARATATALTAGALTKDGFGPRITQQNSEIEALTATLGGRFATMASSADFDPDMLVLVDRDSTTNNWSVSRVRRTSSGSVELYHGLMGFTSPAHMFSFLAGSVTIHDIRQRNGVWEFCVSVFSVTKPHGTISAFMENCLVYTSPNLIGDPYTIQWFDSPTVPLFLGSGKSSVENVAFARGPQGTYLEGDIAVAVTMTGDLSGGAALAGSMVVAVTMTGNLTAGTPALTGALSVAVTMTGALTVAKPLAGGLVVAIGMTGDLTGGTAPVSTLRNPIPLFGWPIYSDRSVSYAPTFSGGSWQPTLPLDNVMERELAKIARSVDAQVSSTTFDFDLGIARPIRVLSIPKHTISRTATIRWLLSDTAGVFSSPLYDSTAVVVGPVGASDEDVAGINLAHVHVLPSDTSAQYGRCIITDTTNPNGYIDLARVIVTGAWFPTTGINVGAKIGLESDTERLVTDGGAALYRPRAIRRYWDFSVSWLLEPEAFEQAFKLQRQLGASGQVLFVFDTGDPYMHERAILGVLQPVSAIEFPLAAFHTVPFRILEEL